MLFMDGKMPGNLFWLTGICMFFVCVTVVVMYIIRNEYRDGS